MPRMDAEQSIAGIEWLERIFAVSGYPTNHSEHATVEITHGFNHWFDCGFYIFPSITEGLSWQTGKINSIATYITASPGCTCASEIELPIRLTRVQVQ
jgi:hypothetical protein